MDGGMHTLPLFPPVYTVGGISPWPVAQNEMDRLGVRTFRCVGVHPGFFNRLVNSGAAFKESK
jgi:hypothetical protein